MPLIIDIERLNLILRGSIKLNHILHDISLKIQENDTVAVIGPSGSGKTSLLMAIAGLERADSARLDICGQNLSALDDDGLSAFRARNIGIVFQSFHLIPTMTALENVALPLEFARDAQAKEKAQAALAALGLSHRMTHYPAQLSGGEQQRVAIARAFAPQPKLLLADEPTGNLDRETGEQVIRELFALRERHGTTLMLITHDPALAARCSRVVSLADGRIVTDA